MTNPDDLLFKLQALSNPVRLWIISEFICNGEQYVRELAHAVNISRPLLKMHLCKLESATLVSSEIRTAENGKSANFFRLLPFELLINPEIIGPPSSSPSPWQTGKMITKTHESNGTLFTLTILILLVVLVIFAMKYIIQMLGARARMSKATATDPHLAAAQLVCVDGFGTPDILRNLKVNT